MTTIRIDEVVSDPSGLLPVAQDLRTYLATQLGTGGWWFQSDPAYLVDAGSGSISQANNVAGGPIVATQATPANRPTLTSNQFGTAPNQFPGLVFDGTDTLNITTDPDLSGTFTMLVVAKPTSLAALGTIFRRGAGTGGTDTSISVATSGALSVAHRGGSATTAAAGIVAGTAFAAIIVGTPTLVKARVNGGTLATSSALSGNPPAGVTYFGTFNGMANPFFGPAADLVLIRGVDLLDGSVNSAALLAQWQIYFPYEYGVTL